ncbi:MAG TPA: hypothetical protein V6C97_02990 [Oculatellaceae cyanobacterium]
MSEGTGPDENSSQPSDFDPKSQRQSIADGVLGSVKHLQEAHATGLSSIRKTDRVSQVILVLAIVAVAVAQVMPSEQFIVMVIADVLLALSLCAFLALRFGVLRTLGTRQAILVWQLILGSFLLGLFLAFNLKMIVLLQSGISVGR